ncbi:glycosyltransferase family 4 protein [Abyssicoccus albus]|uniref:glycosyltransferase family 4 protein n=1 Tax=Abyssicoccus albus TaxID=1817405 RepID=UPI00097E1722|nr:glycosyltransferase family 4 protein [Abyssicoccus albus]AQL55902.1 capsule biosynthesis protein CapM [Abyssicoccus albus]
MVKLYHVVTVSKSLPLMKGQIEYLQDKGFNVNVISSPGQELNNYGIDIATAIEMKREISIKNDIISLFKLINVYSKNNPDIVNSGTPKAGLLSTVAAFLTNTKVRVYTVRGLRLETVRGINYYILYIMEKIAMTLATDVIAISPSLKDRIIDLKLVPKEKVIVLGEGSSNGLTLELFDLKKRPKDNNLLKQIEDNIILGYIGRIVKDKGIGDIVKVFKEVSKKYNNVKLLIIGTFEEGDPIDNKDKEYLINNPNIILLKHQSDPIPFFNIIDIFLFLTAREGFGNVSIEAQALETPVITYNVTGAKDTVIHEKTGYIVPKGSYKDVLDKVVYLIDNPEVRKDMGINSRKWVFDSFSNELIWQELCLFYNQKLSNK